jgi:polysaccharide biosynthesis PFTS motif protein
MWAYGASGYWFLKDAESFDFKDISISNISSSIFYVWNEDFANYVKQHEQKENLKVIPIGPLMCGDEYIMKENQYYMNNIILNKSLNDYIVISVFDSPMINNKYIKTSSVYPEVYTDNYNYHFMKDMMRLLKDNKKIYLVYKPKRSLVSKKFSYHDKLKDLFDEMEKTDRFFILDYQINPWIPFALADICISVPFTSSTLVGLHYGKPSFFHDAMNIVINHRYTDLSEYITHNYDELNKKIGFYVELGKNSMKYKYDVNKKYVSRPGINSTEILRDLLLEHVNKN